MVRRQSLNVLIALAALALVAGSSAFAQPGRNAPRASATSMAAQPMAAQASNQGFGVAESLSGKIQMVVVDQDLLVVTGPNGVPYDLKVTPKTVIVIGDKRGTLASLANSVGKAVSVGFVPRRDGNYATRIEVTG
jgi:hypothetical protein